MSSFLHLPVSSAVRKQSTTMPLRLNPSSIASSKTNTFSTLCSSSSRLPKPQTPLQRSNPTPALPTQQTRSFLAQIRRQTQAQAHKEHTTTTSIPPPSAADLQLTNLPYFIRRTPSNQYPVYLVTKAGGTKRQTKVQKTEGDLDALRSDLARYLGFESGDLRAPKSADVAVNRVTGHIIVKGWRKPEILKFLSERNF
ncbi:mitochondrial 54S ribosomal protein mL49 [Aspergillus ruber CBS 135680]|uniref:Large ribosomal subunit protein mL49 n=1 Tax=Aspergillus ruber (strain CBS 135680) TaxID=1388766 RepID=A0A017SCK5_ASPRC|nr:uncharacterized protein EURHEDRAFT_403201 [Aspergillus ruber CBS 135680]EYE94657.1 hypothetical protein EURHEDRAFT_403201 [Aspergillus ruber CBS 135680]